jgi:hypothetical protein
LFGSRMARPSRAPVRCCIDGGALELCGYLVGLCFVVRCRVWAAVSRWLIFHRALLAPRGLLEQDPSAQLLVRS